MQFDQTKFDLTSCKAAVQDKRLEGWMERKKQDVLFIPPNVS